MFWGEVREDGATQGNESIHHIVARPSKSIRKREIASGVLRHPDADIPQARHKGPPTVRARHLVRPPERLTTLITRPARPGHGRQEVEEVELQPTDQVVDRVARIALRRDALL